MEKKNEPRALPGGEGCRVDFIPLTDKSLRDMLPVIRSSPYLCSDFSAGMLKMWYMSEDTYFCRMGGTYSVRCVFDEDEVFLWPFGKDADAMVDELIKYCAQRGELLRFFCADLDLVEKMRRDPRFGTVSASYDIKWSDYLYDFESALTFRGKKFSGQRNHINRFVRLYGEPDVRKLKKEDEESVKRMLELYKTEHGGMSQLEENELRHTYQLLENMEELDLIGARIVIGGETAAFSLGEAVGDMLVIHVEKALRKYDGIYPAMYRGFVRLAADEGFSPRYVNREDDSGDAGLRTSKQQYRPVRRAHKNLVTVDSPAALMDRGIVLRGKKCALTFFRPEDREAYLLLNTDHENNAMWGYDYREDPYLTLPPDEDTFYDSAMRDIDAGESFNFAVREREDGPMTGEVILWHFGGDGSVEIGCRVFPAYQGRGMGSEAFRLAALFARDAGLSPNAKCFRANAASFRMIKNAGFEQTGEDGEYFYFRMK